MPRPSPYTPEQKTAILDAVKAARKIGKWPDALKAAEEAGYKGGLQYLMQMASASGAVKPRKKAKAAKKAALSPVKKRGRPKGSKNAAKRAPGRTKGSTGAKMGAGLQDIDKIVAQMVEQRVGVAISKAVAALDAAAKELKTL